MPWSLPVSAQIPNSEHVAGVVVVDGLNYARSDAGITAAIASLHGPGQVTLSAGLYEISKEILINAPGISITGVGYGTHLVANNPTANLFKVTSPLFQLTNVEISTTIEHTAGSVLKIKSNQGYVHHVRLTGSFYNGFTLDSQQAGLWTFDGIHIVGGTSWNAGFVLQSATATIASTHLHNVFLSNAVHWKTASIVLDTGVDSFICSDAELGPVLVENSLKGQAPRWIRFTNSFIEAGYSGKIDRIGLQIEAVRDLRYQGYIGTSQYGATIAPGAHGVDISNTEFVNIGRSAVTIDHGSQDVRIVHNTFEDTSMEGDGAYNTIVITHGAMDFDVSYNSFRATQNIRSRFNISHLSPSPCASCITQGNRYGGYAEGPVSGGR
jgi:hypothetical protein